MKVTEWSLFHLKALAFAVAARIEVNDYKRIGRPHGFPSGQAIRPDDSNQTWDERMQTSTKTRIFKTFGGGAVALSVAIAAFAGYQGYASPALAGSVGTAKGSCSSAGNSRWNVCGYDPVYAFRKIHLDFCGRSPTHAESTAFNAVRSNDRAWKAAISTALDNCMKTPYWLGTNGVVWNIANPKIGPVTSIKAGTKSGPIPLADYEWDYNLFSYINSGDRDVRDLLTAQYFVQRTSDAPPTFRVVPEEDLAKLRGALGQPVTKERRVGMLTTHWFTTLNTMFTAIPRTTAAAAYRSYLGYNIAKLQGLHPVEGEPRDFDNKGVEAPVCAGCHSTLDPLTYPFSRYNGISAGTYVATRLNGYVRTDGADVANAPEAGVLFGQPVKDLVEWGRVAANSDDFAKKVTTDYWKVLVGREPSDRDQAEYTAMWRGLKSPTGYNYRVEKMLHALVLTNAYGQP